MRTIAVFGDSISRGVTYDSERGRYIYLKDSFDKLVQAKSAYSFINRSRFGATSTEGLAELEQDTSFDADFALIQYGGNDCTPDWKAVAENPLALHQARVRLEEFEDTLTRFVMKLRAWGKTAVLVTPPPLVAERFVPWISRGLDADAILRYLGDVHHVYRWQEQYALAVHKASRLTGCALLDLRAWFLKDLDLGSLYCADGMHPNGKGHQVYAQAAEYELSLLNAVQ
jgi:acyl-CoA thioesterase-1